MISALRSRKVSIGTFLMATVLATILPLLFLVALVLEQLSSSARLELERSALTEARKFATIISQVLRDMATTGRVISSAPELENGDLEAFHSRTQNALGTSDLFIILVAQDGQQLLNTRVSFGTSLGHTSNLPALARALSGQRPIVSDIFKGRVSGRWVFNVILPLPENMSGAAALIVTKNADDIRGLLNTDNVYSDWSVAVLDGINKVVATTNVEHLRVGQVVDSQVIPASLPAELATYRAIAGAEHLFAKVELTSWSWSVVVWGPVASAHRSFTTTRALLLGGGGLLLVCSIAVVLLLARSLRTHIRQIADMAIRLGDGQIVSPASTPVREIDSVARALSVASFDRSEAEHQTRLLMRELAHRTKNLLSIVLAMVRQVAQSSTAADYRGNLESRLHGLAQSIDLLTSESWSAISIRHVARTHLLLFDDTEKRFTLRGDDILLSPAAVQNLGLILHELATNAVKYGALSVPEGKVELTWTIADKDTESPQVSIDWKELNGPVIDEGPAGNGFGTQIITRHAEAVFHGRVAVQPESDGLHWSMTAPLSTFVEQANGS